MMKLYNIFIYVQAHNDTTWLILTAIGGLLILLVVTLLFQWHDKNKTIMEISHLSSMHKHGVEQELVLKAMKLATWRLDVPSMSFTYDSDFRARTDVLNRPPNCPFDTIMEHVNPSDVNRVREALKSICLGNKEEFHEQYRMKTSHNDGEYWSESYATIAERDESGKPILIVGTSSCIDDVKRLEQDLVNARNKAEESDRLKTSFIDNISHEVRTPLNAIVGFSDILPSVTEPSERNGLITIIKENNQKLLNIFENMMAISKAEVSADKTKMNITDFDVIEMLRDVVEESNRNNTKQAIRLNLDVTKEHYTIHSDFGRLREIITHYISNAFKFTSKGSISVKMEESDKGHINISVTDTGKGIPEEAYERIFDRFVKLDNFVQGAGLGLTVCRTYAYSLGGTVGVRSRIGEGSTFWVDIPVVL